MVTTAVVYAIAKKAGKVPNVISQWVNVKCRIVRVTVDALKVNAIVNVVGKDLFVINVSIWQYVDKANDLQIEKAPMTKKDTYH